MARFDVPEPETGQFASHLASTALAAYGADLYLQLGMRHSAGRAGSVDFIEAHKWFNIAVFRGNREAAALRAEVAAEMTIADIAAAQRAARAFLSAH